MSTDVVRSELIIPRTHHYIWAGGMKLMPEDHVKNCVNWLKRNSGFTQIIWIDKKTSDVKIEERYTEIE